MRNYFNAVTRASNAREGERKREIFIFGTSIKYSFTWKLLINR